ncbi:hypothetical protein N9064_01245 [bacterium]|nr:hypothetical protein [bacterium]
MLSQSEIARDEVYVFRHDYYHLKALNFLMNEKAPRNDAIIAFIKKYKIDVNVQLPVQNVKGVYVPLIYKCMLDNRFQKVTKYLIKCGANVNLLPDSDKITELFFVCNRHYLHYLKNNGCILQLPLNQTILQIRERILQGDIKRIYDLEYLKVLKTSVILSALKEEIFGDLLVNLLNKVAVVCNTTNEKDHVDALLKSYKDTIKFLLNNGHCVSNTQMQSVVNMYLVDIAKTIKEHYPERNWDFVCLIKHKDMNRLKTAYMRQLFNDYNESQLMELFSSSSSSSELKD